MPSKVDWGQIIGGVVIGAILGIAGTFYFQGQKLATLESQIEQLKNKPTETTSKEPSTSPVPSKSSTVNPQELLEIIKSQQKVEVKESRGESASQNFNREDLAAFKKKNVPKVVKERLRHDSHFIDVVLAIKQMEPTPRQNLLNTGLQTYKKTWAELGKVSSEGQTDTGQEAEQMIAKAIVDLVKELYSLSAEKLNELRQ
jgi:hypothetical protein